MSDQLTLAQYIDRIPNIPEHYIEGEPDAFTEGWKAGVKEGADWQKEQSKELINLMKQLITAYSYRHADTKQLLVGYTNEQAIDKMNMLLERLQD